MTSGRSTRTGLRVKTELDTSSYPAGVSVSDAEMQTLYLTTDPFHGEWNYTLVPRLMLPEETVVS